MEGSRKYSSFRLRLEGCKITLTVKEKRDDEQYNVRTETEIEVSDFEKTRQLIEILGYSVFRRREKIREEYKLNNIKIEIDEYPGMLPYLEVEAQTKEDIDVFLADFEFPLEYTTNSTATEIIEKAGLNPNNLIFNS